MLDWLLDQLANALARVKRAVRALEDILDQPSDIGCTLVRTPRKRFAAEAKLTLHIGVHATDTPGQGCLAAPGLSHQGKTAARGDREEGAVQHAVGAVGCNKLCYFDCRDRVRNPGARGDRFGYDAGSGPDIAPPRTTDSVPGSDIINNI